MGLFFNLFYSQRPTNSEGTVAHLLDLDELTCASFTVPLHPSVNVRLESEPELQQRWPPRSLFHPCWWVFSFLRLPVACQLQMLPEAARGAWGWPRRRAHHLTPGLPSCCSAGRVGLTPFTLRGDGEDQLCAWGEGTAGRPGQPPAPSAPSVSASRGLKPGHLLREHALPTDRLCAGQAGLRREMRRFPVSGAREKMLFLHRFSFLSLFLILPRVIHCRNSHRAISSTAPSRVWLIYFALFRTILLRSFTYFVSKFSGFTDFQHVWSLHSEF